ncbi:MAG: hypothetical protein LBL74_07230 [Bacteroidales bacterium]|jgi:long-subunit fatty acid transport protein|nr:hypothetical protein [Bacteroidales bacterium]
MQKRIKTTFLVALIITSGLWQKTNAQTNINSPYSRYGIGNTNGFTNALSSSIGGIGYAFSRNNSINLKNPASLGGIDTMSFVFDIGFYMDFLTLTSSQTSISGFSGALSHISFAFPINKNLKLGVSLVPLSDISYTSSESVSVNDSTFYRKRYDGSGGLDKAILGGSYSLSFPKDKLNIGLNIEYMFGNYYRGSSLIFFDNTDTLFHSSDTNIHRYPIDSNWFNSRDVTTFHINNFNFNFGLQYFHTFNNGDKLGIGGSYIIPASLQTDNARTLYTYTVSNGVAYTKDIVVDSSYKGKIKFPQSFGLGLSYEKPQKFFIGADAQYTKWSDFRLQTNESSDPLLNSLNVGFGMEFTPNIYGNYLSQMTYRLGLNFDNGYLAFDNDRLSSDGTRLNQYGIALGFGLPVRKSSTLINISFEYGVRGTTAENLIRENYFRIGFSLSAKDRWFFKRKYQ